jgi:hypothetical protein
MDHDDPCTPIDLLSIFSEEMRVSRGEIGDADIG